jgi:hypothetical protein
MADPRAHARELAREWSEPAGARVYRGIWNFLETWLKPTVS